MRIFGGHHHYGGNCFARQCGELFASQSQRARNRGYQAGQGVEQSGFPNPGGTDHRQGLTGSQAEVDAAGHNRSAGPTYAEVLCLQYRVEVRAGALCGGRGFGGFLGQGV